MNPELIEQIRKDHERWRLEQMKEIEFLLMWWLVREDIDPFAAAKQDLKKIYFMSEEIEYYFYRTKPLVAAARYHFDVWKLY